MYEGITKIDEMLQLWSKVSTLLYCAVCIKGFKTEYDF